jgi:hypothetical protein
MNEIIEQKDEKQIDIVRHSWTDLDTEQKNGVLALTLARSTNEAARIFKTITKRSRAYFYSKVYPTIKDGWKEISLGLPDDALRILRGGSIAAAYELTEEIKHKDVRIRNKASNDILGHTLANKKGPQVAVQVNTFNAGKYIEEV